MFLDHFNVICTTKCWSGPSSRSGRGHKRQWGGSANHRADCDAARPLFLTAADINRDDPGTLFNVSVLEMLLHLRHIHLYTSIIFDKGCFNPAEFLGSRSPGTRQARNHFNAQNINRFTAQTWKSVRVNTHRAALNPTSWSNNSDCCKNPWRAVERWPRRNIFICSSQLPTYCSFFSHINLFFNVKALIGTSCVY